MKSTAMTATELATTASLVALPTPCVPPDVAANRHDGEAKEERLDATHPHVLHVEALRHGRPVHGARDVELQNGHDPSADHPESRGEGRQQGNHQEAGEHARYDGLPDRIGPQRPKRR